MNSTIYQYKDGNVVVDKESNGKVTQYYYDSEHPNLVESIREYNENDKKTLIQDIQYSYDANGNSSLMDLMV